MMVQEAAVPAIKDTEDSPRCMHYWVIQPATGPVSPGICQSCGEGREFKNYVEGAAWGDSRLATRSRSEASEEISGVVANHTDGDGLEEE